MPPRGVALGACLFPYGHEDGHRRVAQWSCGRRERVLEVVGINICMGSREEREIERKISFRSHIGQGDMRTKFDPQMSDARTVYPFSMSHWARYFVFGCPFGLLRRFLRASSPAPQVDNGRCIGNALLGASVATPLIREGLCHNGVPDRKPQTFA
jgi:hypothetical protein